MAYKITLGNERITLKTGFVLKDELNETLDSGLVSFLFKGDLYCESFDIAYLTEDAVGTMASKKLLVDSYEPNLYSYGSTYDSNIYEYTMTLFSETKELETIVLPNCSVTQPINGESPRTVLDEIKRFVKLYGLKVKVGSTSSFAYTDKYYLSDEVEELFSEVVCPEFQWNRPTLREVLNDLMSTKDCIVVLRNNEIGLMNLSFRGNQIDTTKLLYSKKSMRSQDYVGELSIDLQNAIGKNKTVCCEYLQLRSSQDGTMLKSDNLVFNTQYPIYGIKSVIAYVKVYIERDRELQTVLQEIDITDHVIEYEDFKIKPEVDIGGAAWTLLPMLTDSTGYQEREHKAWYLYFKRGNNSIENIGTPYKNLLDTENFWGYVIKGAVQRLVEYTPPTEYASVGDDAIFDVFFKVEYETISESSMHVGKYLPNKHPNNRIVDNQTNSYVDTNHQSIYEYAKANRLGNAIREVGGNYSSDDEVPQLGDRIGDEVLFSRELCFWDNMVQFKGYLAPNYVLKDFFTGVAAKKRSWQIASEKDALTRHDVYKIYVEASFSRKNDNWNTNTNMPVQFINKLSSDASVIQLLVSGLMVYTSFGGIKYAVCSSQDANGLYYPQKNALEQFAIVLDNDIEIQGMSLCFNFGYNDNYKSADHLIKEDSAYYQGFYAYADSNGEFVSHNVELLGDIWGIGDGSTNFTPNIRISPSQAEALISECRAKPRITWEGAEHSNHGLVFKLSVDKDNREIIKHTIQFEYCSDTKNIIVTRRLIELSQLLAESNHALNQLKIHWHITSYKYELGQEKDTTGLSRNLQVGDISVDSLSNYVLSFRQSVSSNPSAWCITDLNDNILLAVNGSQTTVYFNLLRDRDTNIYDNDIEIVGKLGN